jgi:hypothetical protein
MADVVMSELALGGSAKEAPVQLDGLLIAVMREVTGEGALSAIPQFLYISHSISMHAGEDTWPKLLPPSCHRLWSFP